MFPLVFLGSVGFMLATTIRNGNGAAAVLVVVCCFAWLLAAEGLEGSRWNLFLNPFEQAESYESIVQQTDTFYNRAYLLVGSVLATLFGLLRLQRRRHRRRARRRRCRRIRRRFLRQRFERRCRR